LGAKVAFARHPLADRVLLAALAAYMLYRGIRAA
jgi:hypothetical protein